MAAFIEVRGARLHNLKNISLAIPKNQLVLLTGLSGSGKSTLGFDILQKEGQRQYLEAMGFVSMGMSPPPVDEIRGLSPTVSIDQHLTNHSPRSTVGTSTDLYTYTRILFARLGHRPCPHCGGDVPPPFDPSSAGWDSEGGDDDAGGGPGESFPCPRCGGPVAEMGMADFSFNKPDGACPACTGLGVMLQPVLARLVDESKSVAGGAVDGWSAILIQHYGGGLAAAAKHYGLPLDMEQPVAAWSQPAKDLLYFGVESEPFRGHFPEKQPPSTVAKGRFEGVATSLMRRYHDRVNDLEYRLKMADFVITEQCRACEGSRLKPESRAVTVNGETITALTQLPLTALRGWFQRLPASLSDDERLVAGPILTDLEKRAERLVEVGAGYLTMERGSPSLSAGEAQRLRLAALLGSSLSGLLYLFDEPTIGLHPRDTDRLITVLRRLVDLGNSVLVIEHDLGMIRAADTVIDFGPGGGKHGGQVVAAGPPEAIAAAPGSITGDYLAGRAAIPVPAKRRAAGEQALLIRGATHHNLQGIDVRLPLGLLVAVTGVSGSGKSSLLFDILDRAVRARLYGASEAAGGHEGIDGLGYIDKIVTIDQSHIGRSSRSNAATYTDTFTPIRGALAATAAARQAGLSAKHFSFNVAGGRCERCQGAGTLTVSMHFLPDVEVSCPGCHGRRFKREILAVTYQGFNIAQVLEMTVEEALALFAAVPAARSRLKLLCDVGLGYLQMGQPASTLSGGEAQRVKLAKELGRRGKGHTLYLLDEPTTGLHLADTALLMGVLGRLVDGGNSVILIEHNLELVKAADWVIDLGPEGGAAGGRLIAQGTPEQVANVAGSYTGQWLKPLLPG